MLYGRLSRLGHAPEKPFGFIIDYTGVLKNLGDALASYDALQGFSEEDIARTVVSIRARRPRRRTYSTPT
jgi:hypothetical protein